MSSPVRPAGKPGRLVKLNKIYTRTGDGGSAGLVDGSRDSAVVIRLPPGAYTATASGVGGTTGRALIEVYDLD